MANEQTPAMQGASQNSAQDLDSLTGEFEQGTQQREQVVQPNVPGLEEVVSFVNQQRVREDEGALAEASAAIKGELNVPDKIAKGYLLVASQEDKTLEEKFLNRAKNPEAWNTALAGVASKFAEEYGSIDQQATNDTQDMVAAVHGSKQVKDTSTEAPNYEAMSDSDFQKTVAEYM